MFIIFFLAIFIHELGHILIGWYISKDIPTIRIKLSTVKIIPKSIMTDSEKSLFLGFAIIIGMFTIWPFFYFYPLESSFAMIAYLISCGMDFYNMILLEIRRTKEK